MQLLLDTHILLWAVGAPDRLGRLEPLISDPGTDLLVSAASAWEIAIKHGSGRLPLPQPPATYVPSIVGRLGASFLAVTPQHALAVADLPLHHRDPFDRLLIAVASEMGIPLATADDALAAYGVDLRRP